MKKLITFGVAIIITALGAQMAAAAAPSVLVAHRGLSDAAQNKYGIPEHSRKAYQWAIDNGAEVVDFDVQYTKDNKLVIIHNTTLDENTNGKGPVKDKTLDYIKGLWLELPRDLDGNGNDDNTDQHPLSLAQGLDLVKPQSVNGKPVMISLESKGVWTLDRVRYLKKVLADRGMLNRVIFHSFKLDHVKWGKTAGIPIRGYVAPNAGPLPSPATVKQYASYIFCDIGLLTAAKAQEYQAAGIKVAVGTLDNTVEYDKAIDKMADLWIVNDLVEAQEYLETVE